MAKPKTVSVKLLASLALPDSCPRCNWFKFKMDGKFPLSVFPGVFNSLDSYIKALTAQSIAVHRELPPAMRALGLSGTPLPPMHYTKFFMSYGDLVVRGAYDELLRLADDSLHMLDYKVSKYTESKETLAPLYEAQGNMYSDIAETLKLGTVSRVSLLYCIPTTRIMGDPKAGDEPVVTLGSALTPTGFIMPFELKLVELKRDRSIGTRLVEEYNKLVAHTQPPKGSDGCKDCVLFDSLFGLVK